MTTRSKAASAVLLLASVAAAPCAQAANGSGYGVNLTSRSFRGQAYRVLGAGSVAYVALDSGIDVVDVSTPAAPTRLAHVYLPSEARGIALAGTSLLVADGESGLRILDVSIPSSPTVRGTLAGVEARAVAAAGAVAYVATGSEQPGSTGALHVIDVTDSMNPVELGSTPIPENGANAVLADGAHVYVAAGSDQTSGVFGIAVVDVSLPSAPAEVAFLALSEVPNDLGGGAGTLWAALSTGSRGKVRSVDVTAPTAPALLGSLMLADAADGIVLAGSKAYVAASSVGMAVVDVSSPASPSLLSTLPTGRKTFGAGTAGGSLVLLAERSYISPGALAVVDVTQPASPLLRGLLAHTSIVDVAVKPGLAFALGTDALRVLDTASPASPAQLGSFAPATAAFLTVDVKGTLAAIADDRSVRIVDVSNLASPNQLAAVALPSFAVRPVLQGNYLFALHEDGVNTYDISNPASPVFLGSYATSLATDLHVSGTTAYVTAGGRLDRFDVSNPMFPTPIDSVATADFLLCVRVAGTYAYVGGYAQRLHVFDLSTSPPAETATLPGGPVFGLDLQGVVLYAAEAEKGIEVFDVSMPGAATVIGSFDTSGRAVGVAADGFTVHVAAGDGQLWTLDDVAGTAVCSASAVVSPASPVHFCVGVGGVLDGSGSSLTSCPSGPVFAWSENGVPIPGANSASYTVPSGHAAGTSTFTLAVSCSASSACSGSTDVQVTIDADVWPTVAPNSLRAARRVLDSDFSWQILSGTGGFNLHRSLLKGDIGVLWSQPASFVATSAVTSATDVGYVPPAGASAFYQVYGRGSCTGASEP